MVINFSGDVSSVKSSIDKIVEYLDLTDSKNEYEFILTNKKGCPISVEMSNQKCFITFDRTCHFNRAFGLALEYIQDGKDKFSITEYPQFNMNGPMFDLSQGNAAFNVKTFKEIIVQLALMGLDTVMMYCEDGFEVKSQPYLGYMRARYTAEEIKELDDYAYDLGIELIPHIQTLAHMQEALHWKYYNEIADYDACLLVGEEKTYEFIKDVMREVSSMFRTNRMHVGMDEAFHLGRGEYLTRNGYKDTADIMKEHLVRVSAIADELGIQPMMWDHMYFCSFGEKKDNQYGAKVPEEIKRLVPKNMTNVWGDYYKLTEEKYIDIMSQHKDLCNDMIFAGGIWSWLGYGFAWDKTKRSTELALKVCKNLGVKDVLVTTWGDHGTEALIPVTLLGCQLYAEHGYADKIDYNKLAKRFKFCTGGNYEDFAALDRIDRTPQNAHLDDWSQYNSSKSLMWQDILTGLLDYNFRGFEMNKHYEELTKDMKSAVGRNGELDYIFDFNYHVSRVLEIKAEMGIRLTDAYKNKDLKTLTDIATNQLPDLFERVKALRKVHKKYWYMLYKPLGWDIVDLRYGGLMARITSAIETIEDYLEKRIDKIEELEVERLAFDGIEGPQKWLNDYHKIASPSRIAAQA